MRDIIVLDSYKAPHHFWPGAVVLMDGSWQKVVLAEYWGGGMFVWVPLWWPRRAWYKWRQKRKQA